jgi:LysR family transcriptional regulator, glycine cleavage system transcriptional activator
MDSMARRLPPLNAVRAFEAVARHQSVSAAADELCVTHSAVSRHVSKLEDHLGEKLFVRDHQRLTLTPRGAAYALELTHLFDGIERATTKNFRVVADRKPLHIGVYPTFAHRVLIPRLSRFQEEFPDIPFHVETSHGPPDPSRLDVDVAVMLGRGDWPNLAAEVLCPEELVPVCSPKLLSGRSLTNPAELASLTLLHAVPRLSDWEQWFGAVGVSGVDPYRGMRFDSSGMAYQAAVNALGVAMAQTAYIQEELDEGRLVVLFDTPLRTERSFCVVYAPARRNDPKIVAFSQWLKREFDRLVRVPAAASVPVARSRSSVPGEAPRRAVRERKTRQS